MTAVAENPPQAEWFLARAGDQFGPLSDVELRKLVEMGHLKPTDLLWRDGFPEWRTARILLPDGAAGFDPSMPGLLGDDPAADVEVPTQPVAVATPPQPAQQQSLAPQLEVAFAQPQPYTPQPVTQQPLAPQALAPSPHSQGPRAITASLPAVAPMAVPQQRQPAPYAHQAPTQAQRTPAYAQQPAQFNGPSPQARGPQQPLANPAFSAQPMANLRPASAPAQRPAEPPRAAPVAPGPDPRRQGGAPVTRRPLNEKPRVPKPRAGAMVWTKRVAAILFFAITLAAAGWSAYPYRDRVFNMASAVASLSTSAVAPSPISGFAASVEVTDNVLQKAPLWQTLKREFPDWYNERIKEASALSAAQKPDSEIAPQMMQAIMALRRKHAGDALSATAPRLKSIASAFTENLVRLRKVSVDACHGFVSAGEVSPAYQQLLADPSHTGALQIQLVAVFEAVGEGRKLPRIYPQPKQTDYNLLVTALEKRGWSESDMQLFSDSRAFGKASPEKVCQMVTDWFQSQLEMTDVESQLRLLADSLRPVVAG